jgi:hypothetical protein
MRRSNSIRCNKSTSKSADHSEHHGAGSQPALPGVALPNAPRCLVDCHRWAPLGWLHTQRASGCIWMHRPAPHFHEEGLWNALPGRRSRRCSPGDTLPWWQEGRRSPVRASRKLQADAAPSKKVADCRSWGGYTPIALRPVTAWGALPLKYPRRRTASRSRRSP